jgi:hypothetical protein
MARLNDAAARDLDETRRLLYMALLVGKTKKYNLAGTIVNAIRHHQHADTDADPSVLEDRVVAYCNRPVGEASEDDAWIRDQVRRCIDALGDDDEAPSPASVQAADIGH